MCFKQELINRRYTDLEIKKKLVIKVLEYVKLCNCFPSCSEPINLCCRDLLGGKRRLPPQGWRVSVGNLCGGNWYNLIKKV